MRLTSYNIATSWLHNALILCNNITELDPTVYENARFDWDLEDENGEPTGDCVEIYQWYITDCTEHDVEFLENNFSGLLFTYSELLDKYILCVDHYGTSWDYITVYTALESAADRYEAEHR